jgi:hypothetical protein
MPNIARVYLKTGKNKEIIKINERIFTPKVLPRHNIRSIKHIKWIKRIDMNLTALDFINKSTAVSIRNDNYHCYHAAPSFDFFPAGFGF